MRTPDEERSKPKTQVIEVRTAHLFVSPLGFHFYASEFLDAARSAKRPEHFSPVPYYLYCRSIELSLKSFLLCKGVPKDDLRAGRSWDTTWKKSGTELATSESETFLTYHRIIKPALCKRTGIIGKRDLSTSLLSTASWTFGIDQFSMSWIL